MAARRRATRTKPQSFAIRRWRESKAVRRARAAEIIRRLRDLYPEAAAELNYRNPFQFLIAVILSAQTTDVTVNRVTPELFRRYPTPQALAAAPQLEVEEVIRQTGFFRSKARAVRETAAQLLHEFDGEVPRTMPELLRLRGVARKTANVVLGEAFGIPSGVVVDTHVKRLSQRLGLSRATDPVKIERDLTDTLDQRRLDLRRHRRHLARSPGVRRPQARLRWLRPQRHLPLVHYPGPTDHVTVQGG